jgi:Family of unknown function (DUF6134)
MVRRRPAPRAASNEDMDPYRSDFGDDGLPSGKFPQMTAKYRLCAAAVALLAMPLVALAEDAGEYTFTILKDGDPVGVHRFAFDRDGNRVEIQEATEIDVRVAMIPVYWFEHEGHQVWKDGRAIQIDATTNDNGEELEISVRPNGAGGYSRTVNGRIDEFDDQTAILAFWNRDTLEHNAFISAVEDKTLEASFQFVGREKIVVAGKELEVDHYRMEGDEERDLWYDTAGHIAKVELRRLGSEIAYVRDQLTPRALKSRTCGVAC